MQQEENNRKLGQILVDRGIITSQQLENALIKQSATGRFIGEVLANQGIATQEQIAQSLSQALGLAFVDVLNMAIEPKVIELVPESLCLKWTLIPLFILQNTLTVAMSNPLDLKGIGEVENACGCRVKPVFACAAAIRSIIEKQYPKSSPKPAQPKDSPLPKEQVSKDAASIIGMVNTIITKAVKAGASDIHLEPQKDSFDCRYRIDGILYPASKIPSDDQAAVISRIKIMANMDIAEKRLPQDGRIRMNAGERDVDLRISTFPSIYGENVVIRILDRFCGAFKLQQLGLSGNILKSLSLLIHRPYGMILVTGPTGSGKTTTLYAALNEINSLEKNIITFEDPVEYEIPHIHQAQVNVKAGLTFATGLRSIVRQDPDIIMIGEIRDKETADIAIHAALTGHLVFSTLHTNDAPSAVTRLIDMGVEPYLIASSLIGVLAQRLVRTLCSSCKQSYEPPKELLSRLGNAKQQMQETKGVFYKENGCLKCNQRGYHGRTGIYELFLPNDRIKDLITKKVSSVEIRKAAFAAGMGTLRQSGLEKVASGTTSASEILRVTEQI